MLCSTVSLYLNQLPDASSLCLGHWTMTLSRLAHFQQLCMKSSWQIFPIVLQHCLVITYNFASELQKTLWLQSYNINIITQVYFVSD